ICTFSGAGQIDHRLQARRDRSGVWFVRVFWDCVRARMRKGVITIQSEAAGIIQLYVLEEPEPSQAIRKSLLERQESAVSHQWSLGLDVTLSTAVSLLSSSKIRMVIQRLLLTGQSTCVMLSGRGAQSPPSHAGHAMEQTLHTGDFLAGLGACIGAVQSVYLHGLLATVNEGSSPGRLLVLNGAVRPDLVCETLEEWSCKPASLSPFSSALSGRAAFSLQLCPGSGPSVHPLSGPQYGLLSRISNTPLPLNSVIWSPVLKSCSAGGGRVFTLP
ncbi:Pentatricopeptide repeat-containing protein, partial [Dissostichus eleginoides]